MHIVAILHFEKRRSSTILDKTCANSSKNLPSESFFCYMFDTKNNQNQESRRRDQIPNISNPTMVGFFSTAFTLRLDGNRDVLLLFYFFKGMLNQLSSNGLFGWDIR